MAVLELGAIDPDDRLRIARQTFGEGFHGVRLTGPGGPQKEQRSNRPSGRGHTCQESLIHIDNLPASVVLTHDALAQILFQILSSRSPFGGIQQHFRRGHWSASPLPSTCMDVRAVTTPCKILSVPRT